MLTLNKEQMTAFEDAVEDEMEREYNRLKADYDDLASWDMIDSDAVKMKALEVVLEG